MISFQHLLKIAFKYALTLQPHCNDLFLDIKHITFKPIEESASALKKDDRTFYRTGLLYLELIE